MKTASTALKAHLAQGQTTIAFLWKVKRTDGVIHGFTGHDLPITYDDGTGDGSIVYQADSGFVGSAVVGHDDLKVDNLEATGFLQSDAIAEADIRAGIYDGAIVQIRIVNWADLTMGDVLLRSGTLGVVKMKNGLFTAELRGLAYKLGTVLGDLYGPLCRASFGSGLNGIGTNEIYLCNFDVTTVRQTGSVGSVTAPLQIVPASGLTGAAGWFNDGWIKFTSGVLNGLQFEIRLWDGTNLLFFLPLPFAPAPGDTFQIEPGCNKTPDDCQNKFSNIVNFRGEPFIPGMDQILKTPNDL